MRMLRTGMRLKVTAWIAGMVLLSVGASMARAQERQDLVSAILTKVGPSVVAIRSDDGSSGNKLDEGIKGYGFVVDAKGLIVTNYHVVEGMDKAVVVFAGHHAIAVKGFSAYRLSKDMILLQIDPAGKSLEALSFAKHMPAKNDRVFAFIAPIDRDASLADGIVSATPSGVEAGEKIDQIAQRDFYKGTLGYDPGANWIQTTIPTTPNTSGGPLLNDRGAVVGMTTWVYVGKDQNLALSASDVAEFVNNAMKIVLPLDKLPPPRKHHPERCEADGNKTLAAWNQLAKLWKGLCDETIAAGVKLPKIPKKNPRWPQKMAEFYQEIGRVHREFAAKVRQLECVDVDLELVQFGFKEADLAQRVADTCEQLANNVLIQSFHDIVRGEWRLNDLRREADKLPTARRLVLFNLSSKFDVTFPDTDDPSPATPDLESNTPPPKAP